MTYFFSSGRLAAATLCPTRRVFSSGRVTRRRAFSSGNSSASTLLQYAKIVSPPFPDMTRPYDPALRALAHEKASELGFGLKEGVYIACTGPSYETPAEYKFFRRIGADAVGMSTVPEVAVARHCGLPCFAVSVITDLAHDDIPEDYVTDGEAIVKAADLAAGKMTALFYKMIESVAI